LKLGTGSYGGKDVKKTAIIHTNDPANPKFTLTISGHVEKFVDLSPKYVRLTGYSGAQISVPVTIVPTAKYPFKIIDVTLRDGTFIKYTLTERKPSEGGGYTLLIENLKTDKGRYMDLLTLTTDSQIQPKITIRAYGNIMEPK
jgi:hypothetical protein